MSVIGPRPGLWNQDLLIAERDKYGANDVKPGLTGWAQINGRDELEIQEKPYGKSYHKDNDFDAFICGSDQIWQVSMPGLNYAFFLRFASENKRIAYAVSLGSVSIPKFNRKKFVKVVSGFKAISVRERKSKEMIEEICLNSVTHVLDPTLLVGRDFWDYKSNKTRINDRYILYRCLPSDDEESF